jgi:hypothetical protein
LRNHFSAKDPRTFDLMHFADLKYNPPPYLRKLPVCVCARVCFTYTHTFTHTVFFTVHIYIYHKKLHPKFVMTHPRSVFQITVASAIIFAPVGERTTRQGCGPLGCRRPGVGVVSVMGIIWGWAKTVEIATGGTINRNTAKESINQLF